MNNKLSFIFPLLLFLFCMWKLFGGFYSINVQEIGNQILIDKGSYHYTFFKTKRLDANWRLFGNETMAEKVGNRDIGALAVLSHLLFAGSVEESNQELAKNNCEKNAVVHANFLQVIANNGGVNSAINHLPLKSRLCVHAQGTEMALKQYQHNNDEPSNKWDISSNNLDSKRIFLITQIDKIVCNSQ